VRAEGFLLRDYQARDLGEIESFWVAAWNATGIAIDFSARAPWLREHLMKLIAEGVEIIVGVDEEGCPAGFVTIHPKTGHLDQLCVAPSSQGGGLAHALLDEAKRRSPGRIHLEVNEDNRRACRFYEHEKFEVDGLGKSSLSGMPVRRMSWRVAEPITLS
jgi:putative acetyltransferase